jgi:diphthine-ammonia ligase
VAAAGLRPERHLGATLCTMWPVLHSLRARYGINVCGEGGEYETLTLDCPALFTHGKVVLDGWEAVVVSPDSLAPVALLRPTAFHVERRGGELQGSQPASNSNSSGTTNGSASATGGGMPLEGVGGGMIIDVPAAFRPPAPAAEANADASTSPADALIDVMPSVRDGSGYVTVTAHSSPQAPHLYDSAAGTEAALAAVLQRVAEELPGRGLSWQDAVFVHLYLPSMAQFAAANAAYARFFPAVNPPARATVQLAGEGSCPAAGWEAGGGIRGTSSRSSRRSAQLVAEVLFCRGCSRRGGGMPCKRVLHVQSISAWAPSCIGPYSQAVSLGGLVRLAGQIALDPATMTMVEGNIEAQCQRCLQSCQV